MASTQSPRKMASTPQAAVPTGFRSWLFVARCKNYGIKTLLSMPYFCN
jgi:hypothetical protein